ncbi:ABC transporter ATP-binding protein [Nocardioides zeae]|uniref:ABC-type quaternary amine transporter n=1 Tax=Nocardioides zeae TaxID=1457234 RepID=A0AAJ1X2V7_9ACTN|nr:ABC transporter ATP-binding protein [Nocardioides zeae]MDQ1105709.1 ABC-type Fe3+/spermidine/putrescine transport system ATPase subunit [Nocardioides zeae]
MSELVASKICLKYKDNPVLRDFDLSLASGEFVTLLGASGSGKTSMLRIIGGYVNATSGTITVEGRDITTLQPQRRNIGTVFQQYALFPHMTVADNVAFGLRTRRVSRSETTQRVMAMLEMVDLTRLADRYPAQLSGGQQQRVALARSIVINPSVLLMDEPMGALDVSLRVRLQQELKRIQTSLGITTLYVTHDQSEAFAMSDRIVVVHEGRPVDAGKPQDLFFNPRTEVTARLLGHVNLLDIEAVSTGDGRSTVLLAGTGDAVTVAGAGDVADPTHLLLRAGAASIASDAGPAALKGTVVGRTFADGIPLTSVKIGRGTVHLEDRQLATEVGDVVGIDIDPERVLVLGTDAPR